MVTLRCGVTEYSTSLWEGYCSFVHRLFAPRFTVVRRLYTLDVMFVDCCRGWIMDNTVEGLLIILGGLKPVM